MTQKQMFNHYIALGDSMSINSYPSMDYMDKYHSDLYIPDLGAAALLYKNNDKVWPEFDGCDLVSLCPETDFAYYPTDGATTLSVLDNQVPQMNAKLKGLVLITLTVGGNDLIEMIGKSQQEGDRLFAELIQRLDQILRQIRKIFAQRTIILGTVYDPTHGQNDPLWQNYDREISWFNAYNRHIREICSEPDCLLADIWQHFLGHAENDDSGESWLCEMIEPNFKGASEIRRLWLRNLDVLV